MRKTYIKSRKRSITNLYIPVLTSTIINMWTIVFHLYPHPQEYFEANCRHPIISSINISIRVPVINLTFLCAKPTLLCSSVWFCSWTLEPFLFCQLARCEALSLENTWVTLEEERHLFQALPCSPLLALVVVGSSWAAPPSEFQQYPNVWLPTEFCWHLSHPTSESHRCPAGVFSWLYICVCAYIYM